MTAHRLRAACLPQDQQQLKPQAARHLFFLYLPVAVLVERLKLFCKFYKI